MDLELEYIKKALKEKPKDAQMLKTLGTYYLMQGQFKEALEKYQLAFFFNPRLYPEIELDFEKLLEAENENISARLAFSNFQLAAGETEEAILELEEALSLNPLSIPVYNLLGQLYLQTEKFDEAIALLEKAGALGIKDLNLTEMLAGAYLERGRLEEAIDLYEERLKFEPKSKRLLRILGELYTRLKEFKVAADKYLEMAYSDPESLVEVAHRLEDLVKIDPANVHIRKNLAEVYVKSLKPDLAVKEFREVLRLDSTKLDEVLENCKKILGLYPGQPEAISALAEAYLFKGSYTEAVAYYQRLAELNSSFADQAINGYKKVIEFFPYQALAHESLGEAYLSQNLTVEALGEFRKVLKLEPSAAEAIIQKCLKILKDKPNLTLAHEVLGEAYSAQGEGKKALEEGERVIGLNKDSPSGYIILGRAYAALGFFPKATQAFRQALEMEPFNIDLHQIYENAALAELKEEAESLKKKIEGDPWKLSFHLDLAKIYIKLGYFEEAIRELQIAVKDQARAGLVHNLIGYCFKEDGRFDLAALQFQKALESLEAGLEDLKKTIRLNLGTCLEAQGMLSEALTTYENILQEDIEFGNLKERVEYLKASSPSGLRSKSLAAVLANLKNPKAVVFWGRDGRGVEPRTEDLKISFGQDHNQAGFEYFVKGRFKAAEEEFNLSVALDSRLAPALNNLGILLVKRGKLGPAELKIKASTEIDSTFSVLHNNLGLIYYLKGDLKDAEKEFRLALDLDKTLTAAQINLGDVLYLQGQTEEAITFWQNVGDFNPLTEFAKRRMMFLK